MLITEEQLLEKLAQRLCSAERVSVAVAWAGPGHALTQILRFAQDAPNRVRAIVGISGNATYPRALQDLNAKTQLRIPQSYPLFHPKLFLFHRLHETTAWVGSANLTRCGFEQNAELVSEVADDGSFSAWFEQRWAALESDPTETIKRYVQGWRPPAPPVVNRVALGRKVDDQEFGHLLRNVSDWQSFVAALKTANVYWNDKLGVSVDGETSSWLNTANLGNEIIRRESWNDLSKTDYQLLMGIERTEEDGVAGYALLGSMRGAGYAKNVFNSASPGNLAIREKIRAALQPVLSASATNFPQAASDFLDATDDLQGFSGGVATRLLTLARPDLAVTVNNGSREGLAAWSGLSATGISRAPRGPRAASYLSLLDFLALQPWYANPEPSGVYERSLANARAALLDCLVYRDQSEPRT